MSYSCSYIFLSQSSFDTWVLISRNGRGEIAGPDTDFPADFEETVSQYESVTTRAPWLEDSANVWNANASAQGNQSQHPHQTVFQSTSKVVINRRHGRAKQPYIPPPAPDINQSIPIFTLQQSAQMPWNFSQNVGGNAVPSHTNFTNPSGGLNGSFPQMTGTNPRGHGEFFTWAPVNNPPQMYHSGLNTGPGVPSVTSNMQRSVSPFVSVPTMPASYTTTPFGQGMEK